MIGKKLISPFNCVEFQKSKIDMRTNMLYGNHGLPYKLYCKGRDCEAELNQFLFKNVARELLKLRWLNETVMDRIFPIFGICSLSAVKTDNLILINNDRLIDLQMC